MSSVTASGERSIAVGGDAINSLLVTGDNNTFFVGRYERLVDAYLSPHSLYRELALDRFTGREWLVALVDEFIAANDNGYLIIEAEAGLGKSTFVAWLARERGYVHHFVRLMPDPLDNSSALKNLNSQLIRAWDLHTHAVGGVLPPTAGRPEFLAEVLADAARRRDALRPDEPLVILVDGLNEAVVTAGRNVLGLPSVLPAGVYVVATQRPVYVPLQVDVARVFVRIDAGGSSNMEDAGEYLDRMARSPEVAARLAAAGMSPEAFVEALLRKSGGVWIYLHYVVWEIAHGARTPDEMVNLPPGLWQYYSRFWFERRARDQRRWAEFELPVLTALAAAAEPLPADLLARLAGLDYAGVGDEVAALLDEEWRPFLEVDESGEEFRYQLFHDSLREFLHGQVDTARLASAERSFCLRLAAATRAAHARIADRYLGAWGGLADGLPGLAGRDLRDEDGGYGLRHLVEHLDHAGRADDLHTLMALSAPDGTSGTRQVNLWFDTHRRHAEPAAYRSDVRIAWRAAQRAGATMRAVRSLRYALIWCSLNSRSANTPPNLWPVLVRSGQVSYQEALAGVRQIPAAEDRAEALTRLLDSAPPDARRRLEEEALASVRVVPDRYWRVGELWRLSQVLSEELRGELVTLVDSIGTADFRGMARELLGLDGEAPLERVADAFAVLPDAADSSSDATALAEAYLDRRGFATRQLHRAEFGAAPGAGRALAVGGAAEQYWRAHVLADAVDAASDGDRTRLAVEAGRLGEEANDAGEQAGAWAALGARLGATAVPPELSTLRHPVHRAVLLLAVLAQRSSPPVPDDGLATDARAAFAELPDDECRAGVLALVAPAVGNADLLRDLPDVIGDPRWRAEALVALAPQLTDPGPAGVAAHRAAGQVIEAEVQVGLLVRAAEYLPVPLLRSTLADSGAVTDEDLRWSLRVALGRRWCELGDRAAATAVLSEVGGSWRPHLVLALATAAARDGDAATALRLADDLPHPPMRAQAQALALRALEPRAAAAQLASDLGGAASTIDFPSAVTTLARSAAVAPEEYREQLIEAARVATARIDDQFQQSVARRTLVDVLVGAGEVGAAREVADGIVTEALQAEAYARVIGAADAETVRELADRAAQFGEPAVRSGVREAALVAALAGLDGGRGVIGFFDAVLAEYVTRPRAALLPAMPQLSDAASAIDGPEAPAALALALADIVEWWP